jgi:hypothetical protein
MELKFCIVDSRPNFSKFSNGSMAFLERLIFEEFAYRRVSGCFEFRKTS